MLYFQQTVGESLTLLSPRVTFVVPIEDRFPESLNRFPLGRSMFPFVEWPWILRDVSELNAVASDCRYTGRCNAFFSRYRKLVLKAELPHDKITTWHVVNPYSAC